MLANLGRWLVIAAVLGSILIWSFFPNLWISLWPKYTMLVLFVVGTVLWIVYSLGNLKIWFKKRSTQYALSLMIMALSSLIIIGFLNWGSVQLTEHQGLKKDWTKGRLYSLSDQTLSVVSSLEEQVKIQVWTRNVQSMGEKRDMKTFLESYQGESRGNVSVEILDPLARRNEALEAGIRRDNVIIVMSEKSGREVRIDNFTEAKGEEQITNAIISAIKGQQKTACFIGGYGGPSIENREADGLSAFNEFLISYSYVTKELVLSTTDQIDKSCELLFVIGPRIAPTDRDLLLIKDSMHAGIPVMALIGSEAPRAWKDFGKELGVSIRDDLILSPSSPNNPRFMITRNYSRDVEIVKSFSLVTLHYDVSSLHLPVQAENAGTIIKAFVSTEPDSYAKKFLPGKSKSIDGRRLSTDLAGAIPIAALVERSLDAAKDSEDPAEGASTKKKALPRSKDKTSMNRSWVDYLLPTAQAQEDPHGHGMMMEEPMGEGATSNENKLRLILFSTDTFVTNALLTQVGNRDLVLNSVSYLLRDTETIGIRPREIGEVRLEIREWDERKVFGALFLISVIFMILAARAAGRRARLKVAV